MLIKFPFSQLLITILASALVGILTFCCWTCTYRCGKEELFFKVGIIIDDLKNDGNLEEDSDKLTMKSIIG